jgi:hypothetical protein
MISVSFTIREPVVAALVTTSEQRPSPHSLLSLHILPSLAPPMHCGRHVIVRYKNKKACAIHSK